MSIILVSQKLLQYISETWIDYFPIDNKENAPAGMLLEQFRA